MVKKYRIIIVEDHTLFREGIKALLQTNPGFEIVGEAEDGFNAIVITERLKPDLLLIDLSMPKMNGIEAIREIRNRCRQVKILAVTAYDEEELILAALQYGADGYVLKDATHEELLVGIKSVLSGKRYISSGISEKIIGGYLEGKKVMKARSSLETLTPQERVILKLIAEGWRNKEIAEHLCISDKTAKKHRANIMKKLDLHNIASLTAFAIRKGIVRKDPFPKRPRPLSRGASGP